MSPAIIVLGWVLLHFLWQGTVIALLTAAALSALRQSAAQTRYAAGCAALISMLAAPVLTAAVLMRTPAARGPASHTIVRVEMRQRLLDGNRQAFFNEPVPAPGPASPATAALPIVVGLWLTGVGCLALRLAGGWWRVQRLQRRTLALAPSQWQSTSQFVAARLGVTRFVRVVDAHLVDTPTLVGWLAPVIVLPFAALANLTPAQVEAILAHELAHVRRHDFLVNLLQAAAETLLFYHPGTWWLSARIRTEREHCCDDLALSVCGDRVGYAAALAELETWRSAQPQLVLAATGGSLLDRVRRVLSGPDRREPRATNAALVSALVALIVAGGSAAQYVAARGQVTADAAGQQVQLRIQWTHSQTDHFDMFVPPAVEPRRAAIAALAERAYNKVSADLQHDLTSPTRLVLFESRDALDRIMAARLLPPGDGQAILLAVDRQDAALEASLVHEVTHQLQADIVGTLAAPAWLTEGLAEHELGTWSAPDRAQLIALLRSNRMPAMASLSAATSGPASEAYNVGHAAFDFIDDRWGKAGVRRLLATFRLTSGTPERWFPAAFGLQADAFDRELAAYLADVLAPPPPPPPPPPGAPSAAPRALMGDIVRPSAGGTPLFRFDASHITIRNSTVRDLIRFAYGLRSDELAGGPPWIDQQRFDVDAGGDGDGSHLGSPALRSVLERRFKLLLLRASADRSAYALRAADAGRTGPRLHTSAIDCAAAAHDLPGRETIRHDGEGAIMLARSGATCGFSWIDLGHATGRGVSMASFAGALGRAARVDAPVFDQTGMTGAFDFDFDFRPSDWPALGDALQAQLGLRLVPTTTRVDVIVVDRVEPPMAN